MDDNGDYQIKFYLENFDEHIDRLQGAEQALGNMGWGLSLLTPGRKCALEISLPSFSRDSECTRLQHYLSADNPDLTKFFAEMPKGLRGFNERHENVILDFLQGCELNFEASSQSTKPTDPAGPV